MPRFHSLYIDAHSLGELVNCSEATTFNAIGHATNLPMLTLKMRTTAQILEFPWAQLTACTLVRWEAYTCADGYFILSQAIKNHSRSNTARHKIYIFSSSASS